MTESVLLMIDFKFFGNPWLATIIISMLPIFELKGAIPVGMSVSLWGDSVLKFWQAFFCAMVGTVIITPILLIVITPILNFLKSTKMFKNLSLKMEEKIKNNAELNAKKSELKKLFAVFSFVAIPLPLTGVYMGCAIASFLQLPFLKSCLVIIVGNFVSGVVITLLSLACGKYSLLVVAAFVILIFLVLAFKHFKKRKHYKLSATNESGKDEALK